MMPPIDIARFMTMTDALMRMLSDVVLPENIADAVKLLRKERGAWPEWDIGCLSVPPRELPLVLFPGERRQLTFCVPSDKRFLLSRIEVAVRTGSEVAVSLFDGEKYMARSDGPRLDGCWMVVEPRQLVRYELFNKVKNEPDVMRTNPNAQAVVSEVHVVGFILGEA